MQTNLHMLHIHGIIFIILWGRFLEIANEIEDEVMVWQPMAKILNRQVKVMICMKT